MHTIHSLIVSVLWQQELYARANTTYIIDAGYVYTLVWKSFISLISSIAKHFRLLTMVLKIFYFCVNPNFYHWCVAKLMLLWELEKLRA